MNHAALVIHTVSYPYIQNVALFIHDALCTYFGADTPLLICDTVDEAQHAENTTVFLIGENFQPFRRKPGCRYVYLNFSVVTVLGMPWHTGLTARRAIRYKSKLLSGHLPSIDALLDYYPPQTAVLKRRLKQPVLGFAVASQPNDYTPMAARTYDVCFVCSMNERRLAVRDALERKGLKVSPSKGIVIEEAAAQSRLCLNVHSVKSNHFETPRFVAALSSGTPVVSEPSFAADTIVDRQFVYEGHCDQLPSLVESVLSQPDRLEDVGRRAHRWYASDYFPKAQDQWRRTLASVQDCLRRTETAEAPPAQGPDSAVGHLHKAR